jgi:hypothetical protein
MWMGGCAFIHTNLQLTHQTNQPINQQNNTPGKPQALTTSPPPKAPRPLSKKVPLGVLSSADSNHTNKEHGCCAATPNGIIKVGGRTRVQELKAPFFGSTGQSPEIDQNCRASYLLQVQAQMKAVPGASRADLLSWDPDTSFLFEINLCEELWQSITEWLLHYASCDQPPILCDQTRKIKQLALQVAEECTKKAVPFHSLRASNTH